MRLKLVSIVAVAAVIGSTAVANAQDNSGKRFTLALEGEVEVTPGDPDGTGTATFRINPGQGQLCYSLRVRDIRPATAAHIHEAPAGQAGPVIVGLQAPTSGMSSGCVTVSREQALEIIREPENYYVNVHNAEFPAGALRAQFDS